MTTIRFLTRLHISPSIRRDLVDRLVNAMNAGLTSGQATKAIDDRLESDGCWVSGRQMSGLLKSARQRNAAASAQEVR